MEYQLLQLDFFQCTVHIKAVLATSNIEIFDVFTTEEVVLCLFPSIYTRHPPRVSRLHCFIHPAESDKRGEDKNFLHMLRRSWNVILLQDILPPPSIPHGTWLSRPLYLNHAEARSKIKRVSFCINASFGSLVTSKVEPCVHEILRYIPDRSRHFIIQTQPSCWDIRGF